ncbi:putative cytokinetic ring protein SteA [Armatimonas sp.]|uniref:putative cytokinetic ring protein SteA n=1 Tax=Armatimonas sp. TaxID=1872638 RepID=UPI00286BD974|nr:putative cytokinetic ring protein SteA [Armatimonas sp.]
MIRSQLFTREKEKAGTPLVEVRLGRRTKALAPTLTPGCLVVLDHPDLDAVAAQMLVRARPYAVINCQPFVTGRYPNRGPGVLLDAGIPLYESQGLDLFSELKEGERLTLSDARLKSLTSLTPALLEQQLVAARQNLDTELQRFAQNTLQFLEKPEERALLLETGALPELKTNLVGRHVLVVVRGEGYEEDLERLTFYLRDQKPVVIAVDGAADALLALGIRPEIVLGDMDSVSDSALRCGAEVLVHAYPDGRAPGKERVEALGVSSILFPMAGTSEDAALLLAYEKGADLIVAVGTHSNLEDFLDKGRGGMASTFLVRLKVGSRLVDARGVSRLYSNRRSSVPLLLILTLSALFPVIVLAASTPWGQNAWALFMRSLFR